MAQDTEEKSSDESLIEIAKKRFLIAEEAWSTVRDLELEDLKFSSGDQWPEDVKRARIDDSRPILTIDKIEPAIKQVTNDQRQNRPAIKVSPVDDQADVPTAKILQGIVKHVEYKSNADSAYDISFDGAVRKGRGFLRVLTEYCSPMSFDQDLVIKAIKNTFNVYIDPFYQEADGSDMNWACVFSDMPKDDFKNQFPKSEITTTTDWSELVKSSSGWVTENSVRVLEYFYKEFEEKTICLLSNGHVAEKSKLGEEYSKLSDDELKKVASLTVNGEQVNPDQPLTVKDIRTSMVPTIKWAKLTAHDVLDQTDWLGKWIPIIPVTGAELDIDGERIFEGLVRRSKDSQRMYNYFASTETEAIALAPKAPFVVAEGQIEGHENEWATANTKNHAVLQYKQVDVNGQAAPAPQRQSFEPAVMAITNARARASDDIKSTTGVYDPSLGANSSEKSGIAIQRRNQQAQTSNFHFVDNLARSMRHLGRILVDLIPKIYDTERAVQIIGEDDQKELVWVNKLFEHDGKQVTYQLDKGEYDVVISQGPSYATKRQEAAASMVDFLQSFPQAAPYIGDLVAKNLDWPGADEIAERLKKMAPPGVIENKEGPAPLPPEVQQQMQQQGQMIEQLTQELHQAHDAIDKDRMKIESNERIAFAQMSTDAEVEMAKLGSKEDMMHLQEELAMIKHRQEMLMDASQFQQTQNQNGAVSPETMAPQNLQEQPQPAPGDQTPGEMEQ